MFVGEYRWHPQGVWKQAKRSGAGLCFWSETEAREYAAHVGAIDPAFVLSCTSIASNAITIKRFAIKAKRCVV
jgi:hypothetical protein